MGYLPANHGLNVGGDWYDAFVLPDGRVGMSIGDVQGTTSRPPRSWGRRGWRCAYWPPSRGSGELLARTNDLLISLGTDLFATCTFLRLDPATGTLECARAGHIPTSGPPPTAAPVSTTAKAALRSACSRGRLPVARHRLTTGGVFVLLTDGVVEGPSLHLDDGLRQVVRLAGATAVAGSDVDALVADVMRLAGTVGHEDDAAVLVVGHDGYPPAR
ncbi:PP2C family protein-serine/threonine phosphatase [Streptomyces sp. M19]